DDGVAGVVNHFDWSAVPSPQSSGGLFPVSLVARDAFGNSVNFGGTVQIAARLADSGISIGSGMASWAHPISTFFRTGRSQVIYLATELGGPRQLTGLALNVTAAPGQ